MSIRGRQLSQFSPMRSCLRALLQEAGLKKTHTTSEAWLVSVQIPDISMYCMLFSYIVCEFVDRWVFFAVSF